MYIQVILQAVGNIPYVIVEVFIYQFLSYATDRQIDYCNPRVLARQSLLIVPELSQWYTTCPSACVSSPSLPIPCSTVV